MKLLLVGPGRAGVALCLRAIEAGHDVIGVLGRSVDDGQEAALRLGSHPLGWDGPLPDVDLVVVAVRDDDLAEVASALAPKLRAAEGVVHLAGLVGLDVLRPVADRGYATASFHPLQTLPTPDLGAARLEGAWVGITADSDLLADKLFGFASSLGTHPFEIVEEAKAIYHAAAAASANFPLAALSLAKRLYEAAGVPFEAAQPLVNAVVANAFEIGPEVALTGPVARGDISTVQAQVSAVAELAPDLAEHFLALVRATAHVAGTSEQIEEALE